ncbi:MAG: hypothetical protein UX85_C0007G0084 [Candidatus Beckwithbacteria bacterium GW2011_GWB1_47_15]|uniref:Uncharacterized protein n=1 Tax=Candidatus Beckwithbacteria bacterium GW2011_GWB1_47_15 TaxID=1618371 RepID=A0A0G1RUH3_9BACT|nr:MAG: hypothetical protein UY43_C0001G0496 [Candidatus Beckwithbacteria bacterium GW2011_GWC1_49_16]KKU35153.1 MAG: hypothetical protein UX50_C0006G0079 [Candidatus Beckwithbacteria bacterium GW2011_GWA1_46_30]KKU60797.1 MAG: hypothetical protein UX85_C0007G0084 [Candidatus Beckwithbacteria bacterium GW2011_GWB1_47_15]KKU71602.1 MAG: hypothetical protein UX97_C0005G0085 [Candidatus Beckwithbacteria bacterium GW2011_GWA2_47_25]KKW03445.1 MAG: hypothetical protein UY37_C0005G0008 [Candidatus Be
MDQPESTQESQTSQESPQDQSDLNQEIAAGEWTTLSQHATYRKRSRQGRILAVYQALSNRLDQLVKVFYELAAQEKSLPAAEKMLKEINRLRELRDSLLLWLTWTEDAKPQIPDEVEKVVA